MEQTVESPVDLIRKDRYETEYKLQDIHVKNITVDFFAFPMSAGGLAMVFKFVADMEREGVRRMWCIAFIKMFYSV